MKFKITTPSGLPAKKNDILFSCRGKYPVKYKSQKLKDFETECAYQLIPQKRGLELPITVPVEVTYECFLNHRFNNRDIDNIITTLSDILEDNEILKNDALVHRSIGTKYLIPKHETECATIIIKPYQEEVDKN